LRPKKEMQKSNVTERQVPLGRYKDLMKYFPVPTVDVLFFDATMKKTLLFKRNNKPFKGRYFSVGGRILKNETLLAAATRKAKQETGISLDPKKLFFGGVQDEICATSIFPSIGYHAVDTYFGYVLSKEKIRLDGQHSSAKWFSVTDPAIHPFVKSKVKSLKHVYDQAH